MQRSFLAILSFVMVIVFLALIVVFGVIGALLGATIGQALGQPIVFVPFLGAHTREIVGLIGGALMGFLVAMVSCGVIFTLIAIAHNTRRTNQILENWVR